MRSKVLPSRNAEREVYLQGNWRSRDGARSLDRRVHSSRQPSYRNTRPLARWVREIAGAMLKPYASVEAYDQRARVIFIYDFQRGNEGNPEEKVLQKNQGSVPRSLFSQVANSRIPGADSPGQPQIAPARGQALAVPSTAKRL
jgi:hypothetical protein